MKILNYFLEQELNEIQKIGDMNRHRS